jgi:hypothetical protein
VSSTELQLSESICHLAPSSEASAACFDGLYDAFMGIIQHTTDQWRGLRATALCHNARSPYWCFFRAFFNSRVRIEYFPNGTAVFMERCRQNQKRRALLACVSALSYYLYAAFDEAYDTTQSRGTCDAIYQYNTVYGQPAKVATGLINARTHSLPTWCDQITCSSTSMHPFEFEACIDGASTAAGHVMNRLSGRSLTSWCEAQQLNGARCYDLASKDAAFVTRVNLICRARVQSTSLYYRV